METQISRHAKTLLLALLLLLPQSRVLASSADASLNSNVTVNTIDSSVASSTTSLSTSGNSKPARPRVALVLGGGGLRGVAHIPVLEAIEREHIPIDMVVGTSIGAIVGGLYCAGVEPTELRREGVRDFIKDFYTAPISLQLLKIPFELMIFRNPQGLYSGGTLGKALDRRVGSNMEISAYKTKFAAVTTDLVEGKSCVITSGDLGVALRASAAVPIYRRPVTIGELLLVDGGVLANLPVKQARDLGADFVIAVNIDEKLIHVDPKVFKRKLGSISSRVVGLILAKSDEMQVKEADFCIHPDVTGIGLLSSKRSDGEKAMKAGAEEIEAKMPALKFKLKEAGIIDY